jgi:5'(3')-deoxyribonucleotidase
VRSIANERELQRKVVCVGAMAMRTPVHGLGQARSAHSSRLLPKTKGSSWGASGYYSGRRPTTCASLDAGLGAGKGGRRNEATRALGTAGVDSSSDLEKARTASVAGEKQLSGSKGHSSTKANAPRGNRPRIAVDVDEVLAQFLLSLNAYYADRFGKHFGIEHYDKYYFCKVWGCSAELSNTIVHQFFDSDHFREGIAPVPGALQVLKKLQKKCDLVIVTSRQTAIQDATIKWLETHYPDTFSELYFCNHFALDGKSCTKAEMCAKVKADVLIDDNPGYALECAEAGLEVLLFDWNETYPWSKDARTTSHEKVIPVQDWNQIERRIEERFLSAPRLPSVSLED